MIAYYSELMPVNMHAIQFFDLYRPPVSPGLLILVLGGNRILLAKPGSTSSETIVQDRWCLSGHSSLRGHLSLAQDLMV
jgi:hypothetical protein